MTFAGRGASYETLWDGARAWGAKLLAAGAAPGDRVAIVLPNCPEWITVVTGALLAGLVVTTASPHLTAAELAPIFDDSGASVVVTTAELRDTVHAAFALTGGHATVLSLCPGEDLAPTGPRAPPVKYERPADPVDDVAVLQYTSGTTGGVKAAMMTHRNLVANAMQNNLWFGWSESDVILGALPLCHTWGLCCVLHASLAARARIALLPAFSEGAVFDAIQKERVTVAYGSATMFHRLLDAASADRGAAPAERFRSLRYVKAGAMLVGGDLNARFAAAVPLVPMVNGYGLTEAGPEVTNNPSHAPRAGTVGVPLPGTDVRLCHPDAPHEECAIGEEGEVQVRGPQVMAGYWGKPEETAAAFAGQWLRTGDLGAFEDAGYLVIRDRLKDLIKFRGYSVVPGEVERALREHRDVVEACVVGSPHPRDGEVPVAFVVLRENAVPPSDDAWRIHLNERLARTKHPRRFVVVSAIPKNHVGKPLRRVLRES